VRPWAVIVAGAVLSAAGVWFGLWWAPFAVGVALGLALRRQQVAIPAGSACGLLAWLVPLAAGEFRYGLGPSAVALAEIMGFGRDGLLPVILTLVVGALLGLTGAWVAGAAWAVARPAAR
jgi:hypothetical protein